MMPDSSLNTIQPYFSLVGSSQVSRALTLLTSSVINMLAVIAFIVAVLFISDAKDEQTAYDRKVQIQKEYNTNRNSKYP